MCRVQHGARKNDGLASTSIQLSLQGTFKLPPYPNLVLVLSTPGAFLVKQLVLRRAVGPVVSVGVGVLGVQTT